ncbi:MAG TPA: 50S ribosomal protein L6 [Deltaproteobacteria bacterium]|nr:50S ribosomal protein L6 [Deltaproteobacteria bacterium]
MSRIGKQPVEIPKGVAVNITEEAITVKGPKGELTRKRVGNIDVKVSGDELILLPRDEQRQTRAFHGLMRTLVNNMVVGVSAGFTRQLRIVGVGYRGEASGDMLILNLGYSHPVEFRLPEGIQASVSKDGLIELSGIDKELLGDVAARIRKTRKPDAYKGKGIRYAEEVVRLKPGKSAAKG